MSQQKGVKTIQQSRRRVRQLPNSVLMPMPLGGGAPSSSARGHGNDANVADLKREKLVPMGVSASSSSSSSSSDPDGYRSNVTIFPPLTSSFFKELFYDSAIGRNLVLVALGLVLYIVVSLPSTRQGIIDAGTDPDDARQMYFRPRNVYALLTAKIRSARETQALASLAVSAPVAVKDGPMEFLVFVAQAAEATQKDSAATLTAPTSSSSSSSSATTFDPFDAAHMDQELVVTAVDPKHTLVLNKYNTVDGHALLVTDSYQDQASPLTYEDLEAWYWCLDQIGAVGFYNSAPAAGASQRHKHMQLIPLTTVAALRPQDPPPVHSLPVDDIVMPKITSGEWVPYTPHGQIRYGAAASADVYSGTTSPYTMYIPATAEEQVKAAAARTSVVSGQFYTVEAYGFRHSLAVLMDPVAWKELNQRIDPAYRMPR